MYSSLSVIARFKAHRAAARDARREKEGVSGARSVEGALLKAAGAMMYSSLSVTASETAGTMVYRSGSAAT